jgi:hypothetical protein
VPRSACPTVRRAENRRTHSRMILTLGVMIIAVGVAVASGCEKHATSSVPEAEPPELIVDPVAWTRAFFLKECLGDGEITLSDMDLDQDGINELVVETTAGCGTGGTNYAVFRRVGCGFVFLGTLFGKGVTALPHDSTGNVRVETYVHSSAGEGEIVWFVSRKGEFVIEKSEHWVAPFEN